jgi:C4-dicarboxylate transporter
MNMDATFSDMKILSYNVNITPPFIIIGIAVLGIITGCFYHAFLARVFENKDEDDEF